MKLQIDTTARTIKIEESVNLGALIETLEGLLPGEQYKKFTLEVTVITNWTSPVIIEKPIVWPTVQPQVIPGNIPSYPSYPWITCGNSGTTELSMQAHCTLNNGVYNIDIKNGQ